MQVVRYLTSVVACAPACAPLVMPSLENRWRAVKASEDDVKRISILRLFQRGWMSKFKILHVNDVSPFETHLLLEDGSVVEVDVSKALLFGNVRDPLVTDASDELDVYEGGATRVTPSLIVVKYINLSKS